MAAFRSWADLPEELLLLIVDSPGLSFQSYRSIRGVCSAWRAALPWPNPSVISVEIPKSPPVIGKIIFGKQIQYQFKQVHVSPLTAGRSFPLATIREDEQLVGASNGWVAIQRLPVGLFLHNPPGRENICLGNRTVTKIVFPPNPMSDDYVVAICDLRWLGYTRTRSVEWMTVEATAMAKIDHLVDLAHDAVGGKVYCLTDCGDVHVLDLATCVVEPLHDQGAERAGLDHFDPGAVYAPPYDRASKVMLFKRIFLVGDALYQMWFNTTGAAISWQMPGGCWFRMAEDQVLVLKYDPGRLPRWREVKDLGGCSVFIGKNNPVVLRGGDVPGVRPNCVYWIDEWSMKKPMVFDMATGTTSLLHPAATPRFRTVCWYFTKDNNMSISSDGRNRPLSEQGCEQALNEDS